MTERMEKMTDKYYNEEEWDDLFVDSNDAKDYDIFSDEWEGTDPLEDLSPTEPISPVVKWAGGKRQLLDEITKRLPKDYNDYIEPFLGGGALLFHLKPFSAIVNDLNSELINLYNVIKVNPEKLMIKLDEMKEKHSEDFYYQIRELDRKEGVKLTNIEKAARFLYLNKTGFNGLWRVNKKGQNNVPWGRHDNPAMYKEDNIKNMSDYLNNSRVTFKNEDYKEIIREARPGDFIYLDPPYDNTWTDYTSNGFVRKDQKELAQTLKELDKKGIKWMLSNSDTDFIKEEYKDFNIDIVKASRAINSNGNGRGKVNEVLIYNYKLED